MLEEGPAQDAEVVRACKAGAARCTIQAGDVRGGVALALRSGSKAVMRDCAGLLSGRGAGMVMEAAELYEAADDAEQAAALYLDAKALARAEPLMKRVSTPKLIQSVRPRCRVGNARCKVPPCVWRLVADRNQSIPETCSTTRTLVTLDPVD